MIYTQYLRTPEEIIYDHPEGAYFISRHFEFMDGQWRTFVHCQVYFFSPSILKQMDRVFDEVRSTLPPVIGAWNWQVTAKEEKFMKRFGFYSVGRPMTGTFTWPNGEEHPLWLHVRSK